MVECISVGDEAGTSFMLRVLLYAFLLFSLLSLLFMLVVTKVRNVIQSNIQDKLATDLSNGLQRVDPGGAIKTVLRAVSNSYNESAETVSMHNRWLFRTLVVVMVAMFVLLVTLGLVLFFSCGQCLPWGTLLRDSVVVFVLVSVLVLLFFYVVVRKYIPNSPAKVATRVLAALEK